MNWTEKLLAEYLVGIPYTIVLEHSRLVAGLALEISARLKLTIDERKFIEEAALLHDIGVSRVHAPEIGLYGEQPYISHGMLGREILEKEGFPDHALVAERHTGVGLTVADIIRQKLPLPQRDMCPISRQEQIICFADLFYSKKPGHLGEQKNATHVRKKLSAFGDDKIAIFDNWMIEFGPP
jgi:uncharacterized protein